MPGEKKIPPANPFAGNDRPRSSPYIARADFDHRGEDHRASIIFAGGDDDEDMYLDAVLMPIENFHQVVVRSPLFLLHFLP